MPGIIEKSNHGLFENEVELCGHYSTIVKFLKDELHIFSTFHEAYLTAAVIGFVNSKKGTDKTTEKVQPASIFPDQLRGRKTDFKFLYRVMMLVQDEPGYENEDYIKRTFRIGADETTFEQLKENMLIFNDYACGGLEILYEKFKDTIEDSVIDTTYDFMCDFMKEVNLIEDDSLPDFTPNFH